MNLENDLRSAKPHVFRSLAFLDAYLDGDDLEAVAAAQEEILEIAAGKVTV